MKLSIIAAIGRNNELGKDNDLLWHLPQDMKFFRETTMGHKIVMGRKTFESLPKLLPGRDHIVLTRQNLEIPNVEVYHDTTEFLDAYKEIEEEIFNIGGASIYKELLEYADKLYLTEIDDEKEADVYFPEFNKDKYDREILASYNDDVSFKHVLYKRR